MGHDTHTEDVLSNTNVTPPSPPLVSSAKLHLTLQNVENISRQVRNWLKKGKVEKMFTKGK